MATLPFSVPATAVGTSSSGTRPRRALVRGWGVRLGLGLSLGWGWLPLAAAAQPPPAAPTGPGSAPAAPAAATPEPGNNSAPVAAPSRPGAPTPAMELPRSQRLTGAPAAQQPATTAPAPGVPGPPVAPLTEEAFAALLRLDDLDQLNLACARLVQEDNPTRLRLLQDHLVALRPAPQPLPVLLANAEVLLTCRGPHGALSVLDRYGPGPGAARVQWLLMQWRAANAALDHRRAALALNRLTSGQEARLNGLTLPIRRRDDGTVVSRSAADVLAGHLEARGFPEAAGQLLLRQGAPGAPGAERLGRAVALLRQLPLEEREAILETALNQAAAAGAWSLVSDLLDAQAALPSERALARRLRLSPRLDDAYGQWLLLQDNPAARQRVRQLEGQLRSPRAPGGHAYPEPPLPPAPPAPSSPSLPSSP